MNRLASSLVLALLLCSFPACRYNGGGRASAEEGPKKVAAIVTSYFHNSHADVIVSRLLQTDTLDGKGRGYDLELASLYTDQVPDNDISRRLAGEHGVPIYPTIREALTLGTGELAVDGVLLVAEHGDYPKSPTGNTQFPKRRFFEETVKVFRDSGRVVPVFIDKHIADNWRDMNWIHRTAREMDIPLMAGSSVPGTWRRPPVDVERGAELGQIVAMSYHTLDAYGFHALEAVQALAEQRQGGETGIRAVRCLSGDQVWRAIQEPEYEPELFRMAWDALPRHLNRGRPLEEAVASPTLFILEYADGLRAYVFTLNGAVAEWSAAWRYADGRRQATYFWTQEARPFMHFTYLVNGVEHMMLSGDPAWPAERTLMSSGVLDALLRSKQQGGKRLETPWLEFSYRSDWRWSQPPPPPPGRPVHAQ
jgi:hypothetical protein